MWKRFTDKAASAVTLALFTLIAYAEVYFFASGGFFETNRLIYGYSLLAILLLTMQSGLTLYFGVNLYLSLYHPEVKRNGTITFIAEIATLAVGAMIPVLIYYARTIERAILLVTLPYFLAGLAAAIFLLLIPFAKKKRILAIIAVVVLVGTVCGFAAVSANGREVAFAADPVVLDNGDGFSVVWCTNVDSVGYLEYTYEGRKYTLYDAEDGKYTTDRRVHTVRVPYEHLYGNTYTVSAAKVVKNASRNSKLGNFITSKGYKFAEKVSGDELKMLSLTDWHEHDDKLYSAAAGQDYDLLLMMGDAINYVNEFDDILDHIVIPGGKLTAGVKPALFVRGNHEVRGKYAKEIKSVLGMDQYYFTTTYGEINFLVFDGGDTKPDGEASQGAMNVCDPYREAELTEMESLPVNATGYNVCLCHIPLFSREIFDGDPRSVKADAQFDRFSAILAHHDVKLLISGHEHILQYEEGDAYDTLIAGGPTEAGYVACMITVKAGVATIVAYTTEKTVATYGPLALA